MPYSGQGASKSGHIDIVRNPDVSKFLNECEYLQPPGKDEGEKIASEFLPLSLDGASLPERIVASDASLYAEPIDRNFPSTQIGYVKVSLVLIELDSYDELSTSKRVDPEKISSLQKNSDAFSFVLPGSNVRFKGEDSVEKGFRRAIYEQFRDLRYSFGEEKYSLAGTLWALDEIDTERSLLSLHRCPTCDRHFEGELFFTRGQDQIECPFCSSKLYFTDALRIHEQLSDFGDNRAAITRFMNVTEHLIMATMIRFLADHRPRTLSKMAFVLDGPLAIFGQPARVHARLMHLYNQIASMLSQKELLPPVIMGLQKSGALADHAASISRYLRHGTFRVVDDLYRDRYVRGVDHRGSNFGQETYYGQDFLLKTDSGRIFVVGLVYPFASKAIASFSKKKVEIERYSNTLNRAFELIHHFEFDLYENAVVPVALAHRHASLSLVPGGTVLDFISRAHLDELD